MCLIVIALGASRRHPVIVAANRDEHHGRPSAAATWWKEAPHVLGGRDLLAGGSWLGVDRRGRVAAVTNIRDQSARPAPRSRGALVTGYLTGQAPAHEYAARVVAQGAEFGPFNLMLVERGSLFHASNRAGAAELGPGLHAFSNAPPAAEWPKTGTALVGVTGLLEHEAPLEPLFELLRQTADGETPEQRHRTAHFIVGAEYGTRCSTVVLADTAGNVTFAERSFDAAGAPSGERRVTFAAEAG